ncbi:hypothetical protein KFL_006990060 [Klebsormidium nitens]|uniref:Hpc2-related domain-containing protein n=1 Tax=Klebsormidium nitens TaxID=105231 RepID=A0A1Y1IJ71_KLENI|nr:hypothetical protein KFL_006990060 [Klebsormidium nitens]|eukprot:GAQ90900.1 hypothetical protein KFL_006990060 [Klebsormidium nitens]
MAFPQLSAAPAVVADTRPTWRFQISLAEDEATVVSFKKLVREAERSAQAQNGPPQGPAPLLPGGPTIEASDGPASPPHPTPPGLGGDLAADGLPPPANRFSSVIERIERLYTGHQSDEEEDTRQPAGAAPEEATPRHRNREDDFYDTDDSFIDDDDLDAYFSDQGEPEHQGFVVTKGAVKPRAPRVEGDGAGVTKRKKKRPRVEAAEGKETDNGKKVAQKKETGAVGDKGKPAKKTKVKEGGKKLGVADAAKAKKDKKADENGAKAVKKPAKKDGHKVGVSTDEDAALALPAVIATPAKAVQALGGLPLAEESKGPAKSEGTEAGGAGGASKKAGKKTLLADKVQRALQVSKDREDAQAAAKREADAKRASKKGEGKKRKKEGDVSVGPGEGSRAARTEVAGSILSATVSGVPIGLLNAEVSNARTLGSRPESKKRARAEEDSGTETEETAPAKKVKREAGEEGADDTRSAKPRKPRATDHERLESAIAELASSVAELCPPVSGEEVDGDGAGDEGDEGSKKRRLPGPTQAALSKVARVAGMRKGLIPAELFPRLLPIVGHVLKDNSLKVNLKRALAKALETKKGGATTPKKDTSRKSNGGTPRKKEEGAKKRGQPRESAEEPGAASPAGHHVGSRHALAGENGAPPTDAQCAQRMAEARAALEELISARMEAATEAQRGGEAGPSGSGSGEPMEAGFAWDHPTENALLAVSRVSREGAGEQNGQVARQLYKDLAQLWPPGCMDVAGLQKAIRRAKARADRKGGDEAVGASAEKQGQEEAPKGGKKRKAKAAGTEGGKAGQAQDKGGGDSPAKGPAGERPGPTAAAEGQGEPRPVAEAEAAHSLPSVFKQFQGSPQALPSVVQS